jgi:hypothetical protein
LVIRINHSADDLPTGHQFVEQSEPLRFRRRRQKADAGGVAARPVEAFHQPYFYRITPDGEYDRDFGCCPLGRHRRGLAARRNDDSDATPNQIGGHFRQSIILAFRPSVIDRDIRALGKSCFLKAPAKRGEQRRRFARGPGTQIADDWPRLLGECSAGQSRKPRRHAEKVPPPHT